jgi:putative ABC transport system ATP-binding protein
MPNSLHPPADAIVVDKVTKSYGEADGLFIALDQVSLHIKQGESVAIVGKSGSGKSTLMHLLALMDKPTSGTIMISGKHAGELPPKQLNQLRNRTFGFVFQQFFLNGNASVLENVILPLKIAGVGKRERNKKGMEVLATVELADKAGNKANDLSGGQKQRAVIARALINSPEIIFADEPTGNLDSVTGRKVEDILFGLNKNQGITLLLVTHDSDLAARCKRQIYIQDGRIINQATKRVI